jgi:hypothetical protein
VTSVGDDAKQSISLSRSPGSYHFLCVGGVIRIHAWHHNMQERGDGLASAPHERKRKREGRRERERKKERESERERE